MLLLQGGGRAGQLFNGGVKLTLDLLQPTALLVAGLELVFGPAELLPERLQLGQGGGGGCNKNKTSQITFIPAGPDRSDRQRAHL